MDHQKSAPCTVAISTPSSVLSWPVSIEFCLHWIPFSAIVSIECNNVSYLTADSRGRQLSQWRFRAFDDGVQWPSRSTYIIASSHCMTTMQDKKLSYRRETARRAVSVKTVPNVAQMFIELHLISSALREWLSRSTKVIGTNRSAIWYFL